MIQCPTCQTSYTADRLGIAALLARPEIVLSADVVCPICQTVFSARVEVSTTVQRRKYRFWVKDTVSNTTIKTAVVSTPDPEPVVGE